MKRPCYLCQWEQAQAIAPEKWGICMDCYQKFSICTNHEPFKQQCLELYQNIYAASQNRKDYNEDRAERFLRFMQTVRNPFTEREIDAIRNDVNQYQGAREKFYDQRKPKRGRSLVGVHAGGRITRVSRLEKVGPRQTPIH